MDILLQLLKSRTLIANAVLLALAVLNLAELQAFVSAETIAVISGPLNMILRFLTVMPVWEK